MTDFAYCYHCRREHRADDVVVVLVRGRRRWRCAKSLAASQAPHAQRDDYGRRIREAQQDAAAEFRRQPPLPRCLRELIYGREAEAGDGR
jgi:hypothetical protein